MNLAELRLGGFDKTFQWTLWWKHWKNVDDFSIFKIESFLHSPSSPIVIFRRRWYTHQMEWRGGKKIPYKWHKFCSTHAEGKREGEWTKCLARLLTRNCVSNIIIMMDDKNMMKASLWGKARGRRSPVTTKLEKNARFEEEHNIAGRFWKWGGINGVVEDA